MDYETALGLFEPIAENIDNQTTQLRRIADALETIAAIQLKSSHYVMSPEIVANIRAELFPRSSATPIEPQSLKVVPAEAKR